MHLWRTSISTSCQRIITGCCSILSCICLAACINTSPDEQAIRAILAERQQALHDRAADRIGALISPTYQDKGLSAQAKIAEIANTLAAWDNIDMQGDPPVIKISGDTANVKQRYRLRVKKRGKELSLDGEADLRLHRESTGWKIVSGL